MRTTDPHSWSGSRGGRSGLRRAALLVTVARVRPELLRRDTIALAVGTAELHAFLSGSLSRGRGGVLAV